MFVMSVCMYYACDFMIINTFINMHLLTFLLRKQDERSTCSVSVFLVYMFCYNCYGNTKPYS